MQKGLALLEEVPVDAARFFFNLREPNSHFDFDLDLAVSEKNTNPIHYVQYAHARICSVLRNLGEEGIALRPVSAEEFGLLCQPTERELILLLGGLTDEIITAAKTYDPARLTHYVVEVATRFHKFYDACRVKGSEESLMQARLHLCVATATVLRNVLSLMKIEAPEKM